MKRALVLLLTFFVLACEAGAPPDPAEGEGEGEGEGERACPSGLIAPGDVVTLDAPGPCAFTLRLSDEAIVELDGPNVTLDGQSDEPGWVAPRLTSAGVHIVATAGAGELRVLDHGAPVALVDEDLSLAWTDAPLLDDPSVAGLGRLMSAASVAAEGDAHGGLLFEAWFTRFSTTAHSERVGPALLLDDVRADLGADASAWDLDALPFRVTAVHNRVDLMGGEACGELRVSLASTHPLYEPLHLIFLFRLGPEAGDVSPDGTVHCGATARRWAALSDLTGEAFRAEARAVLDDGLTAERFLLAESVEFTIAPWEWRQWTLVPDDGPLPMVFDNPALFQTVDIEGLNEAGDRRDAFLAFVEENAPELDARTLLIPPEFSARSARANAGVPWVSLDLTGVDAGVLASHPTLRQNLEIVGCPACHTADAEFVQTTETRTFSDFYDTELEARALHLESLVVDPLAAPSVPFGPLQENPALHP